VRQDFEVDELYKQLLDDVNEVWKKTDCNFLCLNQYNNGKKLISALENFGFKITRAFEGWNSSAEYFAKHKDRLMKVEGMLWSAGMLKKL